MIEHVRMVADWLDDATNGVNLRALGALYACADTSGGVGGQEGSVVATTTVTNVGTVTVTFRVLKDDAVGSRVVYRLTDTPFTQIISAHIAWSGDEPDVTIESGLGTVVSTTRIVGNCYEIVLSGTAAAAVGHSLALSPSIGATPGATDLTASGTVYVGSWAFTNAAFSGGDSADMTTWTVANATATAADYADLTEDAAVSVYDDSRSAIMARKAWPDDLKATRGLIVYDLGTEWQIGIQSGYQEGVCRTGVLLVIPLAASADGVADCGYLMRLVRRAINDLSEPTNEADRTSNDLVLTNIRALEEPPPEAELQDVLVLASLVATWDVRDTAP